MDNDTAASEVNLGHVEPIGLKQDELSELERKRKLIEMHKGHESMHMEMMLIFVILIFVAQIGLLEWKKRYYRSYQMTTLAALWIVPVVLSFRNSYWRFIIIWTIFSILTSLVIKKAMEKPVNGSTPRLVYKWFYIIYKGSYILGILSYTVIMMCVFGVNFIFDIKTNDWMDAAMTLLFYGLYYGVVGRDFAELCADRMAVHIGYYTSQGMPTRYLERDVCAVCGNRFLVGVKEEGVLENTYQLSCKHTFHEFCIRGWCIIGKKQVCPYCKEKVDLKRLFPTPWEKPHVLYGQLLDWIRWLLAWQPIIMVLFQGISYLLGLE